MLAAAVPAWAQPQPPKPNPAAPVLKPVAPHGVQRGTAIDLTLTGQNLAEPTGLWTDFPCKATIPPDNNNGKDPAKLLVHLDVPKDAPMGFHCLRLATTQGSVEFPNLLRGRSAAGDAEGRQPHPRDGPAGGAAVRRRRPDGQRGATTTTRSRSRPASGSASRCWAGGSAAAIDPQLTLFDARTGRELRGGHSNDAPGLQTDARLTYTFKDAGDYLIEIRDVSYKGGEDYFYRLRIGDFPCATTPLPLAIKRGAKATIRFAGPNVDGVAPVEVTAPADPAVQAL